MPANPQQHPPSAAPAAASSDSEPRTAPAPAGPSHAAESQAGPSHLNTLPAPNARLDGPVDLVALAVLDEQIDAQILGEPEFSLEELTAASGWSLDEIAEIFLWSGTAAAEPGEKAYTRSDLDGLVELKALASRENLDKVAIGTVARSISFAMERLALTQVEAIVHQITKDADVSDTVARVTAAELAPRQSEVLLQQIATLWRRHYAGAVHRLTTGAILHRGVSDDDRQFPLICAVGFARIVDFTAVTADFDVAAFASFVQDFNNRVSDVITGAGGRIIKLMGDALVWVTAAADTSALVALELAGLDAAGLGAPLQVGVTWCRVMSINGDVFGQGVNLAAKLCDAAPANTVWIDDAAAAQLARYPDFALTPQPEIEIKGLGQITPHQLSLI